MLTDWFLILFHYLVCLCHCVIPSYAFSVLYSLLFTPPPMPTVGIQSKKADLSCFIACLWWMIWYFAEVWLQIPHSSWTSFQYSAVLSPSLRRFASVIVSGILCIGTSSCPAYLMLSYANGYSSATDRVTDAYRPTLHWPSAEMVPTRRSEGPP
jgi:hypothetical protein